MHPNTLGAIDYIWTDLPCSTLKEVVPHGHRNTSGVYGSWSTDCRTASFTPRHQHTLHLWDILLDTQIHGFISMLPLIFFVILSCRTLLSRKQGQCAFFPFEHEYLKKGVDRSTCAFDVIVNSVHSLTGPRASLWWEIQRVSFFRNTHIGVSLNKMFPFEPLISRSSLQEISLHP